MVFLNFWEKRELEKIHNGVVNILEKMGLKVEHSEIRNILKHYGAEVDDEVQRVKFPDRLITDLIERQKEYARKNDIFENLKSDIEYTVTFPDSIPFIYDWELKEKRYAKIQDGIEILKVQHMLPEVKSVRCPVILSDYNNITEPLKRYMLSYEITNKPIGGIGYWQPELIHYLMEMDAIAGRDKNNPGFFSANALISPLKMDERTGEMMLTRAKYGFANEGFASMPISGGNAPVTVEGAALIGAAELLAGAIVADAVNTAFNLSYPEQINGLICSGSMDMKTLQGAFGSPEAVTQDLLVYQLFKEIYNAKISLVPTYVDAERDGIQCTFERVVKTLMCFVTNGIFYYPAGEMHSATVFSNVQAMIDIELGHGLYRMHNRSKGFDIDIELEEIKHVIERTDQSFIITDRTLDLFKNNWYSWVVDRTSWTKESYGNNECQIMNEALYKWKALLSKYERPELDECKLNEMQKVIDRA